MKTIDTLVEDIYETVDKGADVSPEQSQAFADSVSKIVSDRLQEARKAPILRMSNLGSPCERQLWYSVNTPELGEPLPPAARLKFLIGDLWEAVLLFLAEVSGHKVEGRQDDMDLHGVPGHRDAVIDGVTVDTKSASSYSFRKFEDGLKPDEDSFGYLTQLQGYLEAGQNDPLVEDKSQAAFLVGDKTLGKITLDKHPKKSIDYEKLVQRKREMLSRDVPPPRGFKDEPDGKSGNRKLGVNCSYCPFKSVCWPNLQVYVYSTGPKFLTHVEKEPRVNKGEF